MNRIAEGLIFGNNKEQSKIEVLKQLLPYSIHIEVLKFRKVRNKDMYAYKCKLKV